MVAPQRSDLHRAALAGDLPEVLSLLAAGQEASPRDPQGFTPLHLAAQEYRIAVAAALLANGAEVDARNMFGNSPLFTAVFNSRGRGELIRILIEHGADSGLANNAGQTPLGLAELIANYEIVPFLSPPS